MRNLELQRIVCRSSLFCGRFLLGFLTFFCLAKIGQGWLIVANSNAQSTPFLKKTSISIAASPLRAATESASTEEGLNMGTNNNKNQQQRQKKLVLIRHARSEGNEFMARPGNQWGDPTFCDDANLIDAKLTETGMKQVQEELLPKFMANNKNSGSDNDYYEQMLQEIDLVLVSPLTRTQQTFQYGVLPALQEYRLDNMPPILAQPLCTERVYTASDTGRSKEELSLEFPWVDWSLLEQPTNKIWWYSHDNNNNDDTEDEDNATTYQEWRPHGEGQWYAVPGEPMDVFASRMKTLEEWIAGRDEQCILLVAHWGVVRYLTGGYSAANCEVKVLDEWKPLHQQQHETENAAEVNY